MTTRRILLAVMLIVAGWLAIFGDRNADTQIAQPMRPGAGLSLVHSAASASEKRGDEELLAIVPRERAPARTESRQAAAIFGQKSWAPPPPPPPEVDMTPTAPPLPYKYVGKKWEDGKWTIFLARENVTHLVTTGDVLDDTYRIQSIDSTLLVLTYLPLKEEQTIRID